MQIIFDHYIVLVPNEFEVVRFKSGLMSVNAAYFEPNQESKYRFKTQRGIVAAVPATFSETVVDIVDTGLPQQRKFVPSEFIQAMVNQGYTTLPTYWPSTFDEFENITLADYGKNNDVKVNDVIYFDYTITDAENFLGKHNGKNLYKVRVDQVYCVARKVRSKVDKRYRTEIIPQSGWVMVEPDIETWEEIKTESGLVKKPKPEAKTMLGFVRHVCDKSSIKRGDHIVYQRNADYTVLIEGKHYFVMPEKDIICKVDYQKIDLKIQ